MASVSSCILVFLVIFFLGPYLESLPNSVLGAVIIVAIIPLYKQIRDIKSYWKMNKADTAIWYVCSRVKKLFNSGTGEFILSPITKLYVSVRDQELELSVEVFSF